MKKINTNIKRSIEDLIYEAQIDGLKDVKYIRHYTTSGALKKILSSGFIEPNESIGDEDWKGYDLHHKKVVSFHDVRTDPEYDSFIKNNEKGLSMDGYTPTLGLHAKKVCACIELDFDSLDDAIKQDTHLLNIYKQTAKEFVNKWNHLVAANDGDEMYRSHIVKSELADLVIKSYDDEKLLDSLKHIWDQYNCDKKWNDEESKLAVTEIEKIYKKYYPDQDLYAKVKNWRGNTVVFIFDEFSYQLNWGWGWDFPKKNHAETVYKKYKDSANMYKRRNFGKIPENDAEELGEATAKFDVIKVIKILKKYGWRFGDSELEDLFGYGRGKYEGDEEYSSSMLAYWIDSLAKNKNRIINAKIEIRVPFKVPITKDNCTIKYFTGIAKGSKSPEKLPATYEKKYNIEYI